MDTNELFKKLYEFITKGFSNEEIVDEFEELGVDNVTEEVIESAKEFLMSTLEDVTLADFEFDLSEPGVRLAARKTVFLDIETSLVEAYVWRTGKQNININQMKSNTRLLTAAWGTMYDLKMKGEAGVMAVGNHMDTEAFSKDPLDDTFVLAKLWKVLDDAEVIVAHNAAFDKGWILGRFLEKGWKLPSRFDVVCTYSNLSGFNMNSKKLDELSKKLVGSSKKHTDFSLWVRCSNGDVSAFEEMMAYNIGDIHDTLYKVYCKTCQYVPDKAVDLGRYSLGPVCRVTGDRLYEHSLYTNPKNGLTYTVYINPNNELEYVDRYNRRSKKAGWYVKYYR